MKLRVDRTKFAEIVAWIARNLPQRASVPVLAGIKLTFDGTTLTAEGFDYEVSTRVSLEIDGGGDPGTVLVSGRLFAEITKALPVKPVDLTTAGAHLELVCGSSRFTLPTMPVEDYPMLPAMPQPVGTIDGALFAQVVAQAAIAAGRDETLPMMTGVRIEIDGDQIALLATDRYRLAVREFTWKPNTAGVKATALIPAKTLAETAKTLAVGPGDVTVALSDTSHGEGLIGFESAGRRMTSRLLDGANYPPVRSLFPATFGAEAVMPVGLLTEVVKRVALVAERATPVLLSFTDDGLIVEAGGTEEARASEALPIGDYSGEPLTIGFNPQYLIDGLAHVGTPNARLSMVDPFKPAVLTPADTDGNTVDGYRYLLMPIRVSR